MATPIKDLLTGLEGVKQDFKEDWKEDAKADWKEDFAVVQPQQPQPPTP